MKAGRALTASGALALLVLVACAAGSRSKGGLRPLEAVSLADVEQGLAGRRLALVVGVNTFGDSRWPALKHAAADAGALGGLLSDPERGRFDAVEILADPAGVERSQVVDALDRLAASNTSAADTVVIYFSTHGTLDRDPTGELGRYLVTSDSDSERIPASALRVRELLARFEALPSQRKVLILAACHSGAGKSALSGELARELIGTKGAFFVRPLAETSQASMVLTACGWGETAREDDGLGHDIYTHFLLEALSGPDSDGDGAITASEAHAHAMARTYYFSGGRQRPQVESRVQGADPIVLTGRRLRPADPVLFSYLPRLAGLAVRVDGRDKGRLPARVVLAPGQYRLVVCEPEHCDDPAGARAALVDEQVELRPGQELAIESLLERGQRDWTLEVRAGYQSFFDARTRAEYVAPLGLVSLSLSRLRFPIESLETSLDLSLGGGAQTIGTGGELVVDQDLLQISYGLQVLFRLELGPLILGLGPRLAGLHLIRLGFNPDGSNQAFANFTPGLVARLRWQSRPGLTLSVEARVHFLSIHTLGEPVDTGLLDLLAGLGWNF